jgi:phosphatidate cytidylyltransferase
MLKQRLLTAAVLIPLVVAAILLLPTHLFQYLIALIVGLAAWEWFSIIGLKTLATKLGGFALLLASIISTASLIVPTNLVTLASTIWLLISLFVVFYAAKPFSPPVLTLLQNKVFGLLSSCVILSLFFLTTLAIHTLLNGPMLILAVMVSVWLADTGGYFAGKRWGKHKLAPLISPNKTWQGFYGAMSLVAIWALMSYQFLSPESITLGIWFMLMIMSAAISVIGDLFESVYKRIHNVKDSGQLLPGHGGILDRIDSLLAAIPVFYAGLVISGSV